MPAPSINSFPIVKVMSFKFFKQLWLSYLSGAQNVSKMFLRNIVEIIKTLINSKTFFALQIHLVFNVFELFITKNAKHFTIQILLFFVIINDSGIFLKFPFFVVPMNVV